MFETKGMFFSLFPHSLSCSELLPETELWIRVRVALTTCQALFQTLQYKRQILALIESNR